MMNAATSRQIKTRSLAAARVLIVALNWPERACAGLTRWDRNNFTSYRTSTTSASQKFTNNALAERLAIEYPEWSREDIDGQIRLLGSSFEDWVGSLIKSTGIRPSYSDGQLIVDLDQIETWLWLSDVFDQDVLLTYWLADSPLARRIDEASDGERALTLLDWGTTCRATNRDLDRCLDQGIADMHMHFGGVRSPLVEWLRMATPDSAQSCAGGS